jgi:hypothetical protein
MQKRQFKFGFILFIVCNITVSLIGGLIILSGCVTTPQTNVSVFHQPKVSPKNRFSSGDAGHGQVTLTWRNILGANWYNIYVSKIPGAKNSGKKITFVEVNPVTIADLEFGTTYYFVVTAENFEGESKALEEISYTIRE